MHKSLTAFLCAATLAAALAATTTAEAKPKDGTRTIHLFTTNDVHGCYFDSLYVGDKTRPSLLSVSRAVKDARAAYGADNVILIDAGDALQGDNASYYYNYVDTKTKHIYARMAEYMQYDAVVLGNHDVETGHPVYDRIDRTMKLPYLAANAVRTTRDGRIRPGAASYFDSYTVVRRQGLKILVIGFTNANIRSWLSPEIWSGMDFLPLRDCVQGEVDRLRAKVKPDIVIVATHTGTGPGDGSQLESEGRDLLYSLKGVDFLVCAHDHSPYVEMKGECGLINSGSHCRNIGHGTIELTVAGGKVTGRKVAVENIPVDKDAVDEDMRAEFAGDYAAVKAFTVRKVGRLEMPLVTRNAYKGMCDYLNLVHTASLGCAPAQISFAAPLTFNGYVRGGDVIYNDMFTIYPFENTLFIVRMTGREIRNYLEYSYNTWINTYSEGGNLLRIKQSPDPRTGTESWSFIARPYNFDSAAGINYTVDVTKEYGSRVSITTLADGTAFDFDATYNVAMTSYRANGGGRLMPDGAGIDNAGVRERLVRTYPEIREVIYDYFKAHSVITPELVGNPAVIGGWRFVPEELAAPAISADMHLLFPRWE